MRLLEAILEANRRLGSDHKAPALDVTQFREELPLAALTCIDARLNHLFPDVLGVPESEFIWLRNSGNVIFGPTSAMMRSLSVACAIKGGREIAVIGHSDCLVCKTTVMSLTDKLKALGVERSKLPDDLVEFFGLFASERQNVMRACEIIRSSPLIGPKVPVHGLLVDIATGRLEQVVNGYESFARVTVPAPVTAVDSPVGVVSAAPTPLTPLQPIAGFESGAIQFSDSKIGEVVSDVQKAVGTAEKFISELKMRNVGSAWQTGKELAAEVKETARDAREAAHQARHAMRDLKEMSPAERLAALSRGLDKALKYRIIGSDQRQYGPISGAKLLEWLADDRIGAETPVQVEGTKVWQKLTQLAQRSSQKPPPITGSREH